VIAPVLLLALLLQEPVGRHPAAGQGRLLVRLRAEAVDGVDELVVQGREAVIRHLEWEPIRGLELEIESTIPRGDERVVVRARRGRPAVTVVQQPSAANGGELRVRIDDGPHGGAAPLVFELWAVPVPEATGRCDVLLITLDSLRPDHLGAYGYARPTSPNLDAFASGAVRYANAFSTSSFTPPAHASLLTSRQVGDHGLLTWNELDQSQLTLAEVLAAHGYRTGASVNLTLLSENGLGQGFEWRREGAREARTIVSEALEFIRAADERPFFLWLHLYDVHRPYGRVPGWAGRFAAGARAGIGDGEDHYNLTPEALERQGLDPADLEWIVDRYDAGIAYADAQLGPLLAELDTPAHRARTLVVITADHGESLLDHPERLFSHDPVLFSAVTRVPLLVRFPDGLGGGKERADPVSLIDVAPTVLATLELRPPPSFTGRSLRELERGTRWPERELALECWGWERLAALRTTRWLVLSDVARGTTRLFDLEQDPHELHPLEPAQRRAAAALVKELDAFVARLPEGEAPPALDPELLQRLRELGYTGEGD
jgi:arylsulfatase A-like enzyme